jgi:NADPH:quinone reductase-like Zn-dependent oxidoreductase
VKAAWLEAVGTPIEIRDVPDPAVAATGVVVRVLAVRVPSYTRGVFDGTLGYDLPTPLIPGPTCVGQVERVGEDVFDLGAGDVVLCNSFLSSGDLVRSPDEILIGWTGAGSERSRAMQKRWRHGSFAERAHYPAQCLTSLPDAAQFERRLLPFLASLAIADGGLRRAGLEAGQVVVINGATGQLGGAAVLLALARGAARVIAAGRNAERLQALAEIDRRVAVHRFSGERARDAAALRALGRGPADLVVDLLADTPSADPTLAGLDALRIGGTLALVGGVRQSLPLAYSEIMRRQLTIRGSFMFDRAGALQTWNLVRSGTVDLSKVTALAFPLAEIEQAMDKAASLGGLHYALLLPNG